MYDSGFLALVSQEFFFHIDHPLPPSQVVFLLCILLDQPSSPLLIQLQFERNFVDSNPRVSMASFNRFLFFFVFFPRLL